MPKKFTRAAIVFVVLTVAMQHTAYGQKKSAGIIQMVFSSDAHYALTRKYFDGDSDVNASLVNAAMIKKINALPAIKMPGDNGVGAGKKIAYVDYLIQTGDIANRMEIPYQSAAASWSQFEHDYIDGLTVKNQQHKKTTILLAPGNHDITNAIGYYRPMNPKTDPTVMVQIYNRMLKPVKPKTNADYNYATDKINYSRNIGGVHFMFITLWPDSAERIWMQKDLRTVKRKTPVVIFCHDQPTCEAKHFTNPIPPYNMTVQNKFEDLTAEHYKEGVTAKSDDGLTAIEQRGWVKFLKAHPNIKAYFHGNSNWNEFYTYKGPDNDVALNTFRVDSPMKGRYSAKDETKLSFQLITLNPKTKLITVRECLWNTNPLDVNTPPVFGDSKTVSLKVGS